MVADYWAFRFIEDPKGAEEEFEDEDFELESVLKDIETNPDDWETIASHGATRQDSS